MLTVWLRPRTGGELDVARAIELGSTLPAARTYAERKELRSRADADPAATERLTAYFQQCYIRIVGSHWRSIVISGPIDRLIEAFGATVSIYADAEGRPGQTIGIVQFRGETSVPTSTMAISIVVLATRE